MPTFPSSQDGLNAEGEFPHRTMCQSVLACVRASASVGFYMQAEPIDRPVRSGGIDGWGAGGLARSSRSSCPLGVKDTDVTALITEAGSQRYGTFTAAAPLILHQPLYTSHHLCGWTVSLETHAKLKYYLHRAQRAGK